MEAVKFIADTEIFAKFAQGRIGLPLNGEADAYWDSAAGIVKLAVLQAQSDYPDAAPETVLTQAIERRQTLTSGL
jgi:hypothetical protein